VFADMHLLHFTPLHLVEPLLPVGVEGIKTHINTLNKKSRQLKVSAQ
jgi:hypothetical protein